MATLPMFESHAIRQEDLASILRLRRQLKSTEKELRDLEQHVKDCLTAGGVAEPGILTARIKVVERRAVAWKEEFRKYLMRLMKNTERVDRELEEIAEGTEPSRIEQLVVE